VISHIFNNYNNIEIVENVILNDYDYKIFIMSLPKILNLTTIKPNIEEYIKIDHNKLVEWKDNLRDLKKFKVGFVYNGLLSSFIEKYIPLNEFEKLCDLDIDLICIHKKKDIENDLIQYNLENKIHFFDIDNGKPFEDTIHILKNIDLLITIDTYVAHLAGVMNIKTWLLLGYSEWRWSYEETKTYWYDSVELIRRDEKDKELKDLIIKVKKRLQNELGNV
jgi:ADP-heptose:LPS heptosyltransferase